MTFAVLRTKTCRFQNVAGVIDDTVYSPCTAHWEHSSCKYLSMTLHSRYVANRNSLSQQENIKLCVVVNAPCCTRWATKSWICASDGHDFPPCSGCCCICNPHPIDKWMETSIPAKNEDRHATIHRNRLRLIPLVREANPLFRCCLIGTCTAECLMVAFVCVLWPMEISWHWRLFLNHIQWFLPTSKVVLQCIVPVDYCRESQTLLRYEFSVVEVRRGRVARK